MIDYALLEKSPRLLLHCELKPLQGDRIQPTSFPDLGAARYRRPDGTEMLLVESAQSVANRLEATIWDSAQGKLIPGLEDVPYVSIDCGTLGTTNSIQEFHRLNSPYIWNSTVPKTITWCTDFAKECGVRYKPAKKETDEPTDVPGILDLHKFYRAVFKWDPNSVLHGVFLEKLAGRLRMARVLGGFIEAAAVCPVESGGVKIDHVLPSPKALGLNADAGFGNVPYPRTEFVADRIIAYFNLDLALLRGYRLGESANKLLIALALFKIHRFLDAGLRLRAACDLKAGELSIDQPQEFTIPPQQEILDSLPDLISACREEDLWAASGDSQLQWAPPLQEKIEVELPADTHEPTMNKKQKKLVRWAKKSKAKGLRLVLISANQECVTTAKALFSGNEAIVKLIDDAVAKHVTAKPAVAAETAEPGVDVEAGDTGE